MQKYIIFKISDDIVSYLLIYCNNFVIINDDYTIPDYLILDRLFYEINITDKYERILK